MVNVILHDYQFKNSYNVKYAKCTKMLLTRLQHTYDFALFAFFAAIKFKRYD
jgi:hypothetical protein